jgi:hypothetical protein
MIIFLEIDWKSDANIYIYIYIYHQFVHAVITSKKVSLQYGKCC